MWVEITLAKLALIIQACGGYVQSQLKFNSFLKQILLFFMNLIIFNKSTRMITKFLIKIVWANALNSFSATHSSLRYQLPLNYTEFWLILF